MVTADALKSVPIFAGLSDDRLTTISNNATRRSFSRGAFILRAGEQPDGFFIILSGRAKVLISDDEGREVTLATLGPGDYFGEMGPLDDHTRSASVQSLTPCELMHITTAFFVRTLSEDPAFAMCIMRELVRRLRKANRQIESLALLDVYGRVARLLLDLSVPVDGNRVIQRAPSKQEMAYMIGASREMVSRVMTDLKHAGRISVHKRRIVLLEGYAETEEPRA